MEKLFNEFSPKSLQEWNEKIITDLKGKDYESLIWESPEGIKVTPVYNSESVKDIKGDTSHHHSDWEIEQTLNEPTNKQILTCLNGGATALLLTNTKNLSSCLEDVLIQHIHTSVEEPNLDAFIELIEQRDLAKQDIKGSLLYDPLMTALKKGSFETDIWKELKVIKEKTSTLSTYKILNIQGQEYHNSGATSTQELAFSLAQISEYFAHNENINPEEIQVTLGVSTNYFFEIAKFRAIRILWSQLLETYNKEATTLDLKAETGLRASTVFDPHVNMLRTTSECMSATLGGANTINVSSFNAAYKQDDEFAQRMARNISLILKEESYFNKVSDPSAGSYYIEKITDELSQNAWSLFQKIEAQGGWIEAAKSNFIQNEIEQNATFQEEKLNSGETQLLGTNLHPNKDEEMSTKVEIPVQKNLIKGCEFKALNTKRLSTQMDVERLAEEKNA